MGRCLILSSSSSTVKPSRFSPRTAQILAHQQPRTSFLKNFNVNIQSWKNSTHGFSSTLAFSSSTISPQTSKTRTFVVSSDLAKQKEFFKVGADSTGSIPHNHLLQVVETAARTGAQVVMDAVNKPRNSNCKGLTDLVTDTDKNSETAILDYVRKNFQDHLILGEEGGVTGDSSSDYLWCIDPLDGVKSLCHTKLSSNKASSSRRHFILGPSCIVLLNLKYELLVWASEESEDKEDEGVVGALKSLFDPNERTKSGKVLPKAYLKSAKEVVKTLRESLKEDPKDIAKFRRTADAAKESIREYLSGWKGQKTVLNEESYVMLEKAIRTLAGFYSRAGPSAPLPEEIKSEILSDLSQAEEFL